MGVQVCHHVAVAPVLCLLEGDWPAAAQLGDFSAELERPEAVDGGAIDFKSRPSAPGAVYDL